ncbi:MAG: S8 family serine peptidase [Lachnospiraceae bacterium]|nr:S8 family serine peptidase [Lachnospiraceae bacterium]
MDINIRVAIIDNGINEFFIKRKLEKSITINENGICISDTKKTDQHQFQHGTNCAMILEKYCSNCQLISIRILDENGRGAIKSIYPALEWCYKNQIKLGNLSLGTSDFRDCEKLRSLINECAAKGMIIIAATANSGFVSYPASFTNVIGVATTESPLTYSNDYMQMGIDTVVPSEHIVKICDEEIKTSLSNSYAAPYVSALIANRLNADATLDIKKLKKYAKEQSRIEMVEGVYEPDWVYKAYVVGREKKSRAKYYFETVSGEYNEIREDIDTIVAFTMADLEMQEVKSKNLIYLGKKDIHNIDVQGFFWSRETRQQQILNNHYQGDGLEVPVVILAIEAAIDSFYILTELKRDFANGGYNAYTMGMEPECVLYGLEYMPEPVTDHEAWKNFIESQVFYKQSDLVIWCVPLEDREKFLKVYPDCNAEISLINEEKNIFVEFSFKDVKFKKKISGLIDSKDVEEIYHIIETKLTEDEDG